MLLYKVYYIDQYTSALEVFHSIEILTEQACYNYLAKLVADGCINDSTVEKYRLNNGGVYHLNIASVLEVLEYDGYKVESINI